MISSEKTLSPLVRALPRVVLVVTVLCSVAFATPVYCAAQGKYNAEEGRYLDPQVKTNVNKIDPLFDENIRDYKGFERDLQEHKKGVAVGVGRGVGTKDVVGAEEAGKAANDLSRIRANELESRGRGKGAEEPWLNDLFVDYSKPGIRAHKEDADEIAAATDKMMKGLLGKLKDLGVDCKSVRGNVEIEPQYYIHLSRRQERDKGNTIYEPFFCERLRNQYSCNDALTLTCKRKGIKWGEWQDKQIRVPGGELINSGKAVFETHKPRDKVFEYVLRLQERRSFWGGATLPDPYKVLAMRGFLATKHSNATIENISDQMSGSQEGETFSICGWNYCGRNLGSKDYAFDTYIINYKYRDGTLVCQEWQEDWSEVCRLN